MVFLRGEAPNREGWSPNPSADPNGPEHAIWAARTSGAGGAWRVVDATNPELAPDGSSILFVKDGQIYRAKLTPVKPASEVDRGEKAFITEWGVQSDPKWSPDGRKIAFVSTRTDHSFIVVYDVATRSVKYMSPSVDFDTIADVAARQQAPDLHAAAGPAVRAADAAGRRRNRLPTGPAARRPQQHGGDGRARRRAADGAPRQAAAAARPRGRQRRRLRRSNNSPGMMRATFKGGYTLAFYKADVTTGDAQEIWHNQPNDTIAANIGNAHLAGDFVIFQFAVGGGRGGRGGRRQRRRGRAAAATELQAPGDAGCAGGRMGSLLRAQRHGCVGASGAADHHRRADRKSDLDRLLGRRQDLLLLHQRQGYRAAAHLGRAR